MENSQSAANQPVCRQAVAQSLFEPEASSQKLAASNLPIPLQTALHGWHLEQFRKRFFNRVDFKAQIGVLSDKIHEHVE